MMLPWNKRLLKKMDRGLAPWLYFCAGRGHRALAACSESEKTGRGNGSPVSVETVKHILVIRPGGLGDAVLTFPMIHALGRHYPKAHVDVLAEKRNADIYLIHRRVRRIYCYDNRLISTMFRLRRNRYDVVIDTEQFHHLSTLTAAFLRSGTVCGFASPIRSLLLTHPVAYDERAYEAVSFLELAQAVTGKPFTFDEDSPFIEIPHAYHRWAEKIVGVMKTPDIVTIAPGATAKDRIWPCDRYIETIRWLLQNGLSILVLGGKDAINLSETISKEFDRGAVRNLSGKTSLAESAALIQKARAHLSSDTGILHIAYGLGTPTVSLFGPGLHDKWAPQGQRHAVLRAGLACSPCTVAGEIPPCPHGAACIKHIEVNSVIQGLKKVLAL